MADTFKVFIFLSCLISTACTGPYVQSPAITGENPATLVLDKKSLLNKKFGTLKLSLVQREVICEGAGKARVDLNSLGDFYSEQRNIRQERILIPVEKKLVIAAQYSLPLLSGSESCDVAIEFQPKPGAEYIYFAHGEKEKGPFKETGKCRAAIYEVAGNGKTELTEVNPVVSGPVGAFRTRNLFCDHAGNVLTKNQWQKEFKTQY